MLHCSSAFSNTSEWFTPLGSAAQELSINKSSEGWFSIPSCNDYLKKRKCIPLKHKQMGYDFIKNTFLHSGDLEGRDILVDKTTDHFIWYI